MVITIEPISLLNKEHMADMNNCTDYLFLSYVAWARQHLLVRYCSLIPHLEKEEICLNRNLNFTNINTLFAKCQHIGLIKLGEVFWFPEHLNFKLKIFKWPIFRNQKNLHKNLDVGLLLRHQKLLQLHVFSDGSKLVECMMAALLKFLKHIKIFLNEE